ncbi:hypothetical protein [Haloarcula brevis]|uniref:hypothetical protein n=1 Tax=Haloarcula brevis TaxID=3111453 RepID=UPI00300F2916
MNGDASQCGRPPPANWGVESALPVTTERAVTHEVPADVGEAVRRRPSSSR